MVDSSTGQPIPGTVVVDLEVAAGDYQTVAETQADSSGKFSFSNVAADKAYAVAISAANGSNYYTPTLIIGGGNGSPSSATWNASAPIGPGTDLGTIGLPLASGPTWFTITQPVTSQTSGNAATSVTVNFVQRVFIADFVFTIPFPAAQQPSVTTTVGSDCAANTDCATAVLTLAAYPAQYAGYNPNGMTFTTYQGYDLSLLGNAVVPGSNTPDCNPTQIENYNFRMTPGSNQNGQTMAFTGCQ